MNEGLFRKAALARLSSPERLDEHLRVIRPRTWLATAALAALVITATIWACVAELPQRTEGQGVLISPDSLLTVPSPSGGVVVERLAEEGQRVTQGEVLAIVGGFNRGGAATRTKVRSPAAGQLVETSTEVDAPIRAGDPVGRVIRATSAPLRLITYVSPSVAAEFRRGMDARITPVSVSSDQFGFLRGRIDQISEFPASPAAILAAVQDPAIAKRLVSTARGVPIQVGVALERAETPSGLSWSRGNGPDFPLHDGTLASLEVTTSERRPIDIVLGDK